MEDTIFKLLERERNHIVKHKGLKLAEFLGYNNTEMDTVYSQFKGFISTNDARRMHLDELEEKCVCCDENRPELPFKTLCDMGSGYDDLFGTKYIISMRYHILQTEKPPRCLKCGLKNGFILNSA
jgi:hypothetical protein